MCIVKWTIFTFCKFPQKISNLDRSYVRQPQQRQQYSEWIDWWIFHDLYEHWANECFVVLCLLWSYFKLAVNALQKHFFFLLSIALKLLPAKRMLRLLNMHRAASPIARLRSFCYSLRYAQQNCSILMREQTFSLERSPLHSFWHERNRLELSSVE